MSASIPSSEFKKWWAKKIALRSFPIPDDALPFAEGYMQAVEGRLSRGLFRSNTQSEW